MKFTLNKKTYYILVGLIWVLYFVFSIYYIDSIKSRPTVIYELLVCGIIIQLTLISFLRSWAYYKQPTLLDWFRLTTFYVIIANYLTLIDKLGGKITWVYGSIYLKQTEILPTLFVVLVGLLAISPVEGLIKLFYQNKIKFENASRTTNFYLRRKPIFFGIGLLIFPAQILLIVTGVIGYGNDQESSVSGFSFILQILNSLCAFYLLTLGFLKFYYNSNDRTESFFLYLFLILSLTFGLLSGMKENTIVPIVTFSIPFLLGGKTLPKKLMVFGALVIAVIYPLNDNYRDALNNFQKIDKTQAFGIAVAKTYSSGFTDSFKESSDSFSSRLAMFPILQYSVEHESEWKYFKNMDRFAYLPISFFPRFFIPSKPIADTGEVLNKMISGYENNSQTPTTYGWAYLEGGYGYVFLSFLLFGIVISLIQAKVDKDNFFTLLLFGNVLIMMLKVETDIYFLIAKILQDIIIFYIFYKLFLKNYPAIES